jgi:hypothetical protein
MTYRLTPDQATLLNLLAEERRDRLALEERVKALEIVAGLRFADPEELMDVHMQRSHVDEQYEAFAHHNPEMP